MRNCGVFFPVGYSSTVARPLHFKANETDTRPDLAKKGIVFIHPHYSPWCWMNDAAVKLTDALVDAVKTHYGLGGNVPILSDGGSMGGLSTLVWPCYTRHRVSAVTAMRAAGLKVTYVVSEGTGHCQLTGRLRWRVQRLGV